MQRSVDLPSQYATFRNVGDSQRCGGRHWWEWTLLIVTLANVGCMLGLSAVDMARAAQENQVLPQTPIIIGPLPAFIEDAYVRPSFTFDLAMIISSVVIAMTALYGLFAEKKYELLVCPLMFSVALGFIIAEYAVNTDVQTNVKLARILVCSGLVLISIPLTIRTVNEDYWMEYQITGASDGLMGMYRRLRYFNGLLKLDALLVLLLGTLSLLQGLNSSQMQMGFFVFFILYAALSLTVGSFAVNLEIKYLVFGYVVITMFLPLVVPFQIVSSGCIGMPEPLQCSTLLEFGVWCEVVCGILAITSRTYILLVLLQIYRHFGYGLTDAAFAGLISNESTSLLGRQRRLY